MSIRRKLSGRPWASWLLAVLVLWALEPAVAAAAVVRTGDLIRVGPEEVIEEDFYAFGRQVSIQGTVQGDVVAFAQEVEVTGEVRGDVMTAASQTRIAGPVHGSLRAASGELLVSGPVGKDAMLASGELRLTPSARVGMDLFLAAGEARVQAPVQGELRAASGELVLEAPVEGDVRAEVGTLRLTEEARVGGDLRYRGEEEARLAEGATVAGTVERLVRERRGPGPVLGFLIGWVRWFIGLFALGLLLVLASPHLARRAPATLRQSPWKSLGWGAVLFVGLPLVAAGLFVLGLLLGGWWLGLFTLGLYALALLLSFPVVGLFLGRWLLERFGKAGPHVALALLLGLGLLTLVGRVPFLGALVALATILFGLGALLLAAVKARRPAAAPG